MTDIEQALVGSVMLDTRVLDEVAWLRPGDFGNGHCGLVWGVMLELRAAGSPLDLATVSDAVTRRGVSLPTGESWLTDAAALAMPTSAVSYARTVRERAQLRACAIEAGRIAAMAKGAPDDPQAFLAGAPRALEEAIGGSGRAGSQTAAALVDETLAGVEHRAAAGGGGARTGIRRLDDLTGGILPKLAILAARPGIGKSAFAMAALWRSGLPGLLFSREMDKAEVMERLIGMVAGVRPDALHTAKVKLDDWKRIAAAQARVAAIPLTICTDLKELRQCCAEARRWARALRADGHTPGFVVFDYLQLYDVAGDYDNRREMLGAASRLLKGMSHDEKLPVLALAQLNRESEREQRKPRLHDLRECGDLEQDADIVMFLHRVGPSTTTFVAGTPLKRQVVQTDLILAKHRAGMTGTTTMDWCGPLMLFSNPMEDEGQGVLFGDKESDHG